MLLTAWRHPARLGPSSATRQTWSPLRREPTQPLVGVRVWRAWRAFVF
jgi:hypothetical protein